MSTIEAIGSEIIETATPRHRQKVWIDLDNSPHVPFFRPIIDKLKARGYELLITARDAYQVRELLQYYGVEAKVIGSHYGKHKILKALGTIWRALALINLVRKERPDISACHGSRGCLITSKVLGIPTLALIDYEFTAGIPFIKPTWIMAPSVVSGDRLALKGVHVMKYPGIKEDVYLPSFRPDPTLRKRLGISQDALVITVRPPATEAHYHNPESEILFMETLKRFSTEKDTTIILLPRNKRQESELRATWKAEISAGRIVIPDHVEDGLNLIWNADLVISGGGTMNREAAAMGVPVYSIFRGKIGGVDRYLADRGRLVLLESVDDVRTKIKPVYREKGKPRIEGQNDQTLNAIVDSIISLVGTTSCAGRN
jgi:uncharacterized protein